MTSGGDGRSGWRSLHLAALLRRIGAGGSVASPPDTWPRLPGLGWGDGLLPDLDVARAGSAPPVRTGAAPAVQSDPRTCGPAVLVVLAALGDPALAARLVDGEAFAAAQHRLHRAATRGRWPWPPWPRGWGTPPWGAAHVARFGPVRYRSVPVDDSRSGPVVDVVDAALARGIPVPLFTGGDLGGGVISAVPRHVVLALPSIPAPHPAPTDSRAGGDGSDGAHWLVYEPGSGRVHRASVAALRRPAAGVHDEDTRRALGGWTRLTWVLLPMPDRAGRGTMG